MDKIVIRMDSSERVCSMASCLRTEYFWMEK